MDLANTFWIAFDKKQPTHTELINYVTGDFIAESIWYAEKIVELRKILSNQLMIIENFNNHLQKIVTIKMLVVMKDGKPMKKPESNDEYYRDANGINELFFEHQKEYQQAMESVLYEGYSVNAEKHFISYVNQGYTKDQYYWNDDLLYLSSTGKQITISKVGNGNRPITLNWWKELLK